jgi:hypothetical protein
MRSWLVDPGRSPVSPSSRAGRAVAGNGLSMTQDGKRTRSKIGTHGEEKIQNEENTLKESTPREEDAANETTQSEEEAEKKSKPKRKSKAKTKPGPKPAKRRSPPRRSPGKKKIDPPAAEGEGGRQLLTAVNTQVAKRSTDIAKALVDGTVAGSASHARLVVGLSGAGGLAPAMRDSGRAAFTAAELPGSEENWEFDVAPDARPGFTPPKS